MRVFGGENVHMHISRLTRAGEKREGDKKTMSYSPPLEYIDPLGRKTEITEDPQLDTVFDFGDCCAWCRHFWQHAYWHSSGGRRLTVPDGECRINPPRLSGFPIVPADKCCGRFSRAKVLRISPPKIY